MESLKKMKSPKGDMYSSRKNLIEESSSMTDDIESYTNEVDIESGRDKKFNMNDKVKLQIENVNEIQTESSYSEAGSSERQTELKKKRRKSKNINNKDQIENEDQPIKTEIESEDDSNKSKSLSDVESIKKERVKKSKRSKDKIVDKNKTVTCNSHKLIGVHILRCNLLRKHLYLYGPLINIYIVNTESGECYNEDDSVKMCTKKFEFYKKRTMVPHWNEILIFDKKLTDQLDDLKNIIIFFEIVDKPSSESEDKNADSDYESIAWAFIKPLSDFKNCTNINKKLKLQLYSPDYMAANVNHSNVYECWKATPWKIYPSALFIEVIGVKGDTSMNDINNIKFNIMQNVKMEKEIDNDVIPNQNSETVVYEKRGSTDMCRMPNQIFKKLDKDCVTILKFSKCGNFLACSCKEKNKYVIIVYKAPEFTEVTKLFHHQNVVYEISWNFAGNYLLTSSSDCFACLWDMSNIKNVTKQKLEHPSFVYTAKFCNFNEDIIATGCFDKLIRIWMSESSEDNDKTQFVLSEELKGHTGTVNSICFMENIEMFFSGDSNGCIFKWAKGKSGWMKILNITIDEFKSRIINDLIMFPDGHRILVIFRDYTPWALNIATATKSICYKRGRSIKYQTRGTITPCGSMIFISNNIWSSSTGELLAVYNPTDFDDYSIMACDFHPHFNIAAFSSGCENSSILLCNHSSQSDPLLNIEFCSNKIKYPKVPMNLTVNTAKHTFKESALKVQDKLITDEKVKNKEFKLWSLIKKMDGVLLNAKRNNYKTKLLEESFPMSNLYVRDKNDSSLKTENDRILSENLSEIERRVEELKKLESYNGENSIKSNTYTLKNEDIKTDIERWNYRLNDVQHEIEESSTLSNAESLEDDLNTYTISLK